VSDVKGKVGKIVDTLMAGIGVPPAVFTGTIKNSWGQSFPAPTMSNTVRVKWYKYTDETPVTGEELTLAGFLLNHNTNYRELSNPYYTLMVSNEDGRFHLHAKGMVQALTLPTPNDMGEVQRLIDALDLRNQDERAEERERREAQERLELEIKRAGAKFEKTVAGAPVAPGSMVAFSHKGVVSIPRVPHLPLPDDRGDVNGNRVCPMCDGSKVLLGSAGDKSNPPCSYCNGTGRV
jgi:hypothetical protein